MKNGNHQAIILMAIGEKHKAQLDFVLPQFLQYAKCCQADLRIIREPPDPKNMHPILTQKLLIPGLFSEYEKIAFFDLDIILSKSAPSIFLHLSEGSGFSACTSPRGEPGFNNMFLYHYNLPEKVEETHQSYFLDRGFELDGMDKRQLFSINGGVWVSRPKLVSDLFRQTYFGIADMRKNNNQLNVQFEEELMAFTTQKSGVFHSLDKRFNKQVIYTIYEDPHSKIAKIGQNPLYKALKALNKSGIKPNRITEYLIPSVYRLYLENLLSDNFAVHFAGGFEFIGVRPRGSFLYG